VVECEQFTVVVKLGRGTVATRVELLQQVASGSGHSWRTVGTAKAKRKKTYSFRLTAGEDDAVLTYRAKLVRAKGRPVTSDPVLSTVWHWFTLGSFDPYVRTTGVNDNGISPFNLNGQSVRGWFTTGSPKTWESRYTLGRRCQAMRGVVGVRDESADGSSAQLRLLADDVEVYASPSLSPGTAQPFQIALALPFRLAVLAQNTSTPPVSVYPAIGEPQLLCTALA
jgi:hypothetical protein